MNKIFIICIILNFSNCITDEKTNCYSEKRDKLRKDAFGFDNCESAILTNVFVRPRTNSGMEFAYNFTLLNCVADYSVYRQCKNKSQTKPVSGTGEGIE